MKVPRYLFSTVCERLLSNILLLVLATLIVIPYNSHHGDLVLAEAHDSDAEVVEEVEEDVEEVEETIVVNKPSAEEIMIAGSDSYPYTKTFVISAYYSPIPCQSRYATGSLEGDIRLNGSGVNSADGTPVYAGMIAAPKAYAFGTKMHIPGLGTGAVHDRGGAIVSGGGAGGYDRLDIWMGWGDKGLTRALNWGKRTVDVTVYGLDPSVPENLGFADFSTAESVPTCSNEVVESEPEVAPEPQPEPESEPVVETVETVETPEAEPVEQSTVELSSDHETDLELGDSGEEVVELQEELISLNYLRGNPSGTYDEMTQHAVFKFQQANYLVGDINSLGAGVFGPKTRSKLNTYVASRNETKMAIASANYQNVEVRKENVYVINSELDLGDVGPEVVNLQKFLKANGYFDYPEITNYFGPVTQEAVLKFQLDKGIISSTSELGAGRVGPTTLRIINNYSK